MSRSRLSQRFTLYDWNKYSKEFKKTYKKENDKALDTNTAIFITFNKLVKTSIFGDTKHNRLREPEIEDVIELIKLGNKNCKDDEAAVILENYLADENVIGGLTGAMLDVVVDFYTDLNISSDLTKRAIELRQLYIDSKKNTEKNEDTQ